MLATRLTNNGTRFDDAGRPVNAHQGSMLQAGGRYWLYGDWLRPCEATTQCHCVGDDMSTWTQNNGVGIYSTADFVHWQYEAGPVLVGFNQPRTAFFPSTGRYHMYLQFPLRLATSSAPGGPFTLEDGPVYSSACRRGQCGDIGLFVDQDGQAYLIVTGSDNLVRVQRLSDDGRHGDGPASPPFGKKGEAPVLFRRRSMLYAVFGHNCWCCAEGAEAFVWMAAHPLGPWVGGSNINDCSDDELAAAQLERKGYRASLSARRKAALAEGVSCPAWCGRSNCDHHLCTPCRLSNGCVITPPHAPPPPSPPLAPLLPRAVSGQTAFVISVGVEGDDGPPASGEHVNVAQDLSQELPKRGRKEEERAFFLAFDLWMSGPTRDAQYLHFARLDFAADGRLLPLARPPFLLDDDSPPPPHAPQSPQLPPSPLAPTPLAPMPPDVPPVAAAPLYLPLTSTAAALPSPFHVLPSQNAAAIPLALLGLCVIASAWLVTRGARAYGLLPAYLGLGAMLSRVMYAPPEAGNELLPDAPIHDLGSCDVDSTHEGEESQKLRPLRDC